MLGRFGATRTFTGPVEIESYGAGGYAAYDTADHDIATVTADGVATARTGDIGYGYGFDVLADGAFMIYGLSNYGQGSGLAVHVVNANGSERTSYFDAGVGEDLRGASAAATSDGGFVLGATNVLHGSDPLTLTFPQDSNGYTSTTGGRGGDIVARFFDGQGVGGDFGLANTGSWSYGGASASATYFDQQHGAVLGLSNGNAIEVFHDFIAVGRPANEGGGYNQQNLISMRVVSADGTVSGNIQVNTEAPTDGVLATNPITFDPATSAAGGRGGERVVSLGAAGSAVVWHEESYVADSSVYGGYRFDGTDTQIRYFDNTGAALTGEILVVHRSSDLGNINPAVGIDALGDGRIALVFQDGVYGVNGSTAGRLFVSVLGPLGADIETTAITPSPVAGRAYGSLDVASLGDGAFAVSFSGPDQPYAPSVAQVQTFAVGRVIDGHSYAETLNGGYGPDLISGLGGADTLNGAVGNDTLDGGTGADSMAGGLGDDIYYVDSAGDRVIEADGGGTDLVYSSVGFSLAGGFAETLTLTGSGNINATGNGLNNYLTGNAGNNVLDGGGLADTMEGGLGNDTYIVQNANDRVIEADGGGIDTVNASVSFSLAGQFAERLTLTGAADTNATGNALANALTGNAGVNVLDGGLGADTMSGGAGGDSYYVQDAGDVVTETNVAGVDTVYSTVSYTLGSYVENLTLQSSQNLNGTGNELANVITSGSGANLLNGGLGADALNAGSGADTVDGGLGADSLTGGSGADMFRFTTALGSGNVDRILDFSHADDTIQLSNAVFANIGVGNVSPSEFWAGTAAHDSGDRIIYNSASGALLYDRDGTGGSYAAVQFATLATGLTLDQTDFTIIA